MFNLTHHKPVENMGAKNIKVLNKFREKVLLKTMLDKIFTGLFLLLCLSITGCNMKSQFIKDMELGFAAENNDSGASIAVQKYFPVGMTIQNMNEQLRLLKNDGFDIGEYKYEGARNWPDGEFKPYTDEGTRRSLQNKYPIGVSGFTGRKMYETHYIFIEKTAAFDVTVENGSVIRSSGSIWTSGI